MKRIKIFKLMLTLFLVFLMALPPWVIAQGTQGTEESKPFKQEELDQILAPIALYPDELLSQILMASTYPLEIVQADRWLKANKNLKGDALTEALEKQNWDPSVKSLVNFPQVLGMMNEKLDWTQKLGDAFLASEKAVTDTVQKLRFKAQEAGNLKSSKEQEVKKEGDIIIIQSANPEVVYVPTYDPMVVYGGWWWPAYPPYYYYPPGYVAGGALFAFGVGVAIGAAWGGWGHHVDWHGGNINIDKSINIDRPGRPETRPSGGGAKAEQWKHNPEHRKGISYRDQGTAQKFNKASTREATQARDSFRGRADQGGQDFPRGGGDRASTRPADRGSYERGGRDSAFGGGEQGSEVRQQSNRGSSSRQSMSSGGGSGSRGSSGGGSRGGGGRR